MPSENGRVYSNCDSIEVEVAGCDHAVSAYADVAASTQGPPQGHERKPNRGAGLAHSKPETCIASITGLQPSASYRVWWRTHDGGEWTRWCSSPKVATTSPVTDAPLKPDTPHVRPALACEAIVLEVPVLRTAGCRADAELQVEMRKFNQSEWVAVARDAHGLVTINTVDHWETHEFRVRALNAAGSTAGETTGAVAPGLPPNLFFSMVAVEPLSSNSFKVDWSRLTSGCTSSVSWQVWCRRQGVAGDAWSLLEGEHHGSVYHALIACPEGCSFKVLPNILGWKQASAASFPVATPRLPSLEIGAIRVQVGLASTTRHAMASQAAANVIAGLEADVCDALGVGSSVVRVVEYSRG